MDARHFFYQTIGDHEGKLSLNASDNGNYYDPARYAAHLPQRRGMGDLVGSKFGVTAYALVQYRVAKGFPLASAVKISAADIATLTLDQAVDIGVTLFFDQPGFGFLLWNRVTPSIVDKGWGSGTGTVAKLLQRAVGANPDGHISAGGETVQKYAAWIAKLGEEGAAKAWADVRDRYDTILATNEGPTDPDRIFLPGWENRTHSFLPGTAYWLHF